MLIKSRMPCMFNAAELLKTRRALAEDAHLSLLDIAATIGLIDLARKDHEAETGCQCWYEAIRANPSRFSGEAT
jgi:hypothetical protein